MEWIRLNKPLFSGRSPKQNAIDAMLARLSTGPATTQELFDIADPAGRVSAFHELRKERRIHIVGRRAKRNKIYSLWSLRDDP